MRRFTSFGLTIAGAMIGVLLSVILLVVTSREPSHAELVELQTQILNQSRINTCLLLIPAGERDQATITSCLEVGE